MNKFQKVKRVISRVSNGELCTALTKFYFMVVCIGIIFSIWMSVFQHADVYKARPEPGYRVVQDISINEVEDRYAPLGKKIEYRWKLGNIKDGETCLSFYIVHQYADVYFDGKLMYSLKLQEGNKIGKTTASNWVSIPIYREDEGKEVCVDIIPVYEEVMNSTVTFLVGSKYSIYFSKLKEELPQIILCVISMVIGISFLIISIIHKYRRNENANIAYLGTFSFCIGLWKITDISFAPVMFTKNTMALSYISLTMLVLVAVPGIFGVKKQFLKKTYPLLEWSNLIICAMAFCFLILQITNVADFREVLIYIHLLIAISVVIGIGTVFYDRKNTKPDMKIKVLYLYIIILSSGIIIDLKTYYISGDTTEVLYTLIAFIFYVSAMGYISIRDINRKANIDSHTGIYNKSCCNEILDENEIIKDSSGIMMFDLNRLKYTNDKYGHETGDKLISEFAHILRKNINSQNFVGRYGGDEFIVVVKEADEEMMNEIDNNISQAVKEHNIYNGINISYSVGYALSKEYPGFTLRELLRKADKHMYTNKRLFHDKMGII